MRVILSMGKEKDYICYTAAVKLEAFECKASNNENTITKRPGKHVSNCCEKELTVQLCLGCSPWASAINLTWLLSVFSFLCRVQLSHLLFYFVLILAVRLCVCCLVTARQDCPHAISSWHSFNFGSHDFFLLISQIKILKRIKLAWLMFFPWKAMTEIALCCPIPIKSATPGKGEGGHSPQRAFSPAGAAGRAVSFTGAVK